MKTRSNPPRAYAALRRRMEGAADRRMRAWIKANVPEINAILKESLGRSTKAAYADDGRAFDKGSGKARGFEYYYTTETEEGGGLRGGALLVISTTVKAPNLLDMLNRAGIPVSKITRDMSLVDPSMIYLTDLGWTERIAAAVDKRIPALGRALRENASQWRYESGMPRRAKVFQPAAASRLATYSPTLGIVGAVQYRLVPIDRAVRIRFPSSPASYLGVPGRPVEYRVLDADRNTVEVPEGEKGSNFRKMIDALTRTAPLAAKLFTYLARNAWRRIFRRSGLGTAAEGSVPDEGEWRVDEYGLLTIQVGPIASIGLGAAAHNGRGIRAGVEAVVPGMRTGLFPPDTRGSRRIVIDPMYWDELSREWKTYSGSPLALIGQIDEALKDEPQAVAEAAVPWFDSDCDPMVEMSTAQTRDDLTTDAARRAYDEAATVARTRMDKDRAPFDYQLVGMAFAKLRGFRALIADDMGVGKTLQAIGIMAMLPKARPVVVISPTNVQRNWEREIAQALPEFRKPGKTLQDCERGASRCSRNVVVLQGGQGHNKIVPGQPNVYIVSWDSLSKYVDAFLRVGVKLVIADEADYAKTPPGSRQGGRAAALIKLSDATRYVVLLTGTPMPNRPEEIYVLMRALNRSNWGTEDDFLRQYFKGGSDRRRGSDDVDYTTLEKLNNDVRCFTIRRTKSQVLGHILKPKVRRPLAVKLSPEAQQQYDQIEQQFEAFLRAKQTQAAVAEYEKMGIVGEDASQEIKDVVSRRVATTLKAEKLQLVNNLVREIGRLKAPAAVDAIEQFVAKKRPLVVFLENKDVLKTLTEGLRGKGIRYVTVTGDETSNQKQANINKFNDGAADVLIATRAGRAGMNLQKRSADMLFVQRWWVPGWEAQAEDRIYRYGQDKEVTIWFLEVPDSVDARINEKLENKRRQIEQALERGGIEGLRGGLIDEEDTGADGATQGAAADVISDLLVEGPKKNPRSGFLTRRGNGHGMRRTRGTKINPSTVQSLLFQNTQWGPKQAETWARNHGYAPLKVERTSNYVRVRVQDPKAMERGSFRTITFSSSLGIKAVIGTPTKVTKKPKRARSQRHRRGRRGAQSTAHKRQSRQGRRKT